MEDFDDTPKAGEDESSFTTVIGDEEKKDFVLFLHPGFDGLPSWRPSSLSVLALLAFHGVQCEHVVSSNDALSRTGELPVLRTPRAVLCNFRDLTRGLKRFVLRSDQPHCDDRLLVDEQAHLFALDEVCHGVLNRLLMRTWWLMSRNRDLVIEPRTIGHLPWIVRERTGTAFVRHLANNVKPRRPLMMEAFDVFTCLTVKLGDNLFFFGSTPTSLDATAFGYLCAILYTPLPDPILSLLMQEKFPRLVEFVQRVLRDHLNVNVKTLDLPSERPMPKRGRIEQMKSYLPGIANYTFRIALVVGFSYIFWQAWKGSEQK